jgi:hypothetical protein
MFDDLFTAFKKTYPSFRVYPTKDSTSPTKLPVPSPSPLKLRSPSADRLLQKMDPIPIDSSETPTPSLAQLEASNSREINVIVEERSNDFTNRKYQEKHTPLINHHHTSHITNTLRTPQSRGMEVTPKSVKDSQQIVSDMMEDCGVKKVSRLLADGFEEHEDSRQIEVIDIDDEEMEQQFQQELSEDQQPMEEKPVQEQQYFEDQFEDQPMEHQNANKEQHKEEEKEIEGVDEKPKIDSKEDKTRSETNGHDEFNITQICRASPFKFKVKSKITPEIKQEYKEGSHEKPLPKFIPEEVDKKAHRKDNIFDQIERNKNKRKRDRRNLMQMGMIYLSTHKRRSKIDFNKKRDKKREVKASQALGPDQVRDSVAANFKKLKEKATKFDEPNFMIHQKSFLGLKRKNLLLNKENMPANIK